MAQANRAMIKNSEGVFPPQFSCRLHNGRAIDPMRNPGRNQGRIGRRSLKDYSNRG